MIRTYVIDIDGTVSDSRHRAHLAQNKQWDAFHAASIDDPPHPEMIRFVKDLYGAFILADGDVVFCTGRNERYREITLEWLARHDVFPTTVLMRPDDDYTRDGDMKLRMLDQHFGSREAALKSVEIVFDDSDTVIETLRNAGFVVAQIRNQAH